MKQLIFLLLISSTAYGQDTSLLTSISASISMGHTYTTRPVRPPTVMIKEGDYITYRDTAGYGIDIITWSDDSSEIGRITIKGDTIKAIRYVMEQYSLYREAYDNAEWLLNSFNTDYIVRELLKGSKNHKYTKELLKEFRKNEKYFDDHRQQYYREKLTPTSKKVK